MSITTAVSALRNTTLFATLGEDKLNVIAFGAERVRFSEGDELLAPGNTPPECYVLLRGTLEVSSGTADESVLSREIGPGSAVGEVALLGNKPNSVTAVAQEDGEALRISRTLFERMLSDFPEIAPVLRDTIAARLRANLADMTELERILRAPDSAGAKRKSDRSPARGRTGGPSRARRPQR